MPVGAYVMICDLRKGGASANVIAFYWTRDHVSTLHVSVGPDPLDGKITDPLIVHELLAPLLRLSYTGSKPDQVDAWYGAMSTSPACRVTSFCQQLIGEVSYIVDIGERGSMSLNLEGTAAKP